MADDPKNDASDEPAAKPDSAAPDAAGEAKPAPAEAASDAAPAVTDAAAAKPAAEATPAPKEAAAAKPAAAEAEEEPEPEPEPHPVTAALTAQFGERVTDEGEDQCGSPIVRVGADDLVDAMTWLRDSDFDFNYLSSITAVDYTEREPRFDIVYHLYSVGKAHRATVKCGCADGEGVPSMVDLWPAADWLERETYDLYGTEFLGHPDLRRIFLPDDWEGYPLRKDYPLEGPNIELLTRQQAAFRGGHFDRIRGEYEMNDQEREMAGPGVVGALWTPPEPADEDDAAAQDQESD